MKQENRDLCTENQQIKTNIRKESKINELFAKRKNDGPLKALPYEKLMEIKLILQTE
jgi:hypothetical protein